MESQNGTHAQVKAYYGATLQSTKDLKTSACCSTESLSLEVRSALSEVHPQVLERFYGCGSPMPPALNGLTVLDLGCGTGRDAYVISKLVGSEGTVFGLDMTAEQITVAQAHIEYHSRKFGYSKPNTEFRHGYIEDLAGAGIGDNSIDLVVSNCVVNLSPNKEAVFKEIFRVLKPGGELYFSDIFADRRIPEALQQESTLRGECLSGALYIEDFRRLLVNLGVNDYRIVSARPVALEDAEVAQKIGMIAFQSLTIRAFKLPLEDRCEDFGHTATYRGTILGVPHAFRLDDHHIFETGKPMLVCGNTAAMLSATRFTPHFAVVGDRSTHFGTFDCAPSATNESKSAAACC